MTAFFMVKPPMHSAKAGSSPAMAGSSNIGVVAIASLAPSHNPFQTDHRSSSNLNAVQVSSNHLSILGYAMSTVATRFVLALLTALATLSAQAQMQIVDVMPDFFRYDEMAKGKTPEERLKIFRHEVLAANAALYADLGSSGMPVNNDPFLKDYYLPQLEGIVPEMKAYTAEIRKEVGPGMVSFRKQFPDFVWKSKIYLLPSLGQFDGRVQEIDKQKSLLFGLDVIARRKSKVIPLMHHELFHLYHRQFYETRVPAKVFEGVWGEGLAVYVAEKLNPGLPTSAYLVDQDMIKAVESRRAAVLDKLAATLGDSGGDLLLPWLRGDSNDVIIPARAGYYIGWQIAREMAKEYTLDQMVKLKGDALEAAFTKALRALQDGGKK